MIIEQNHNLSIHNPVERRERSHFSLTIDPQSKKVRVRKKKADDSKRHNSSSVLGIDISLLSKRAFFQIIEQILKARQVSEFNKLFIATVNPEFIIDSKKDAEFKRILNTTSLNTADGMGVCLAIRGLHQVNQPRITGSDSTEKICALAAKHGSRVFFLGAAEGIAERAAETLKKMIPGVKICGVYSPMNRIDSLDSYPESIQKQMMQAEVLFVALGAPAQEKWIARNLDKLPNCRIAMGIGGTLDFIAGEVKRAPEWMQLFGIEWLYRLLLNPRRWRRMLKLPIFLGHFIKEWGKMLWQTKSVQIISEAKEPTLLWQIPLAKPNSRHY